MRTKKYYSEQIVNGLVNGYPNIDWKLDERDIFTCMDTVVNSLAKAGFLTNWKMGVAGVSENFITTWDEVVVTDQTESRPSYLTLPVNYADMPMERGIDEIWPLKFQAEGKNHSVVILNHKDVRLYSNNMAGNWQGRLAGFPQADKFYFTICDVKKRYGNMGLRLVVRDSSIIGIDAPYPIPADAELMVIKACVDWFREKRAIPQDKIRDKIDQP